MKWLLRYPGGKTRMIEPISKRLEPFLNASKAYAEPFVGGGCVALWVANNYPTHEIWLNDVDQNLVAFWKVVSGQVEGFDYLKSEVLRIEPEMDDEAKRMECYRRIREMAPATDAERAFRYFFLNKTNYSGKQTSTPIGGWAQDKWKGERVKNPNKRGVACQYQAKNFAATLAFWHGKLSGRTTVTCGSALDLLQELPPETACYVDPPYFPGKTNGHYGKARMTQEQHEQLAVILKGRDRWVLSYEDSAPVKELYQWAGAESVEHAYAMAKDRDEVKTELLIMAKTNQTPSPEPTPAIARSPASRLQPIYLFWAAVDVDGLHLGTVGQTEDESQQRMTEVGVKGTVVQFRAVRTES